MVALVDDAIFQVGIAGGEDGGESERAFFLTQQQGRSDGEAIPFEAMATDFREERIEKW